MTVFDPFRTPRARQASRDIFPTRHPYAVQVDSLRQLSGYSALSKHARSPTFEYGMNVRPIRQPTVSLRCLGSLLRWAERSAPARVRAGPPRRTRLVQSPAVPAEPSGAAPSYVS